MSWLFAFLTSSPNKYSPNIPSLACSFMYCPILSKVESSLISLWELGLVCPVFLSVYSFLSGVNWDKSFSLASFSCSFWSILTILSLSKPSTSKPALIAISLLCLNISSFFLFISLFCSRISKYLSLSKSECPNSLAIDASAILPFWVLFSLEFIHSSAPCFLEK